MRDRARALDVDQIEAALAIGVNRRRDEVVHGLRVQPGIVTDTPGDGSGAGQRLPDRAVTQISRALVGQIALRVQICRVDIPLAELALHSGHRAPEVVGDVHDAGTHVERGITQARGHAERIVRMGRAEQSGARAAAGIHRTARVAPRTGDAGRGVGELGFLTRVAELGIRLKVVVQRESAAPEDVDVLLDGRQIAELAGLPEAAAIRIGGQVRELGTTRK